MAHTAALAEDTSPHVSDPGARHLLLDVPVGVLCFLVAAGYTSFRLGQYGPHFKAQAVLALAEVVCVLLPGLILTRAFPTRGLMPRLGVGYTAGLGLQLIGWFAAVRTGFGLILWVLPILLAVLATFGARRLRRRTETEARPDVAASANPETQALDLSRRWTPWWASIIMLVSWLLILASLRNSLWRLTPLDYSVRWYQDMDWQLSVSGAAVHSAPVLDPQSSMEGMLSYHWFANAHVAALRLASGVGLDQIGIVAWYVPVMAALLGLVYGMASFLAKSQIAGSLAVLFLALPPAFSIVPAMGTNTLMPLIWLSQSLMFSLPVAVLLAWTAIIVLRRDRVRVGEAAFLLFLAVLATGSKVSLLPTVLGGVGIVFLTVLRHRRAMLRALTMGAAGVVVVLATLPLFGGGGGGSSLGGGATVTQQRVWKHFAANGGVLGGATFAVVCAIALMEYAPSLLVAALWFRRRQRATADGMPDARGSESQGLRDPAAPLYIGIMIVALGAVFFLKHPTISQVYFMRGIVPISDVFIAWGFIEVGRRAGRRIGTGATVALMLGVGVVGGFVAAWIRGQAWGDSGVPSGPALVALAFALVAVSAALLVTLTRRGRIAAVAAAALASAVLGASFAQPVSEAVAPAAPLPSAAVSPPSQTSPLSPDEVNAGRFLARDNTEGALVATNLHCRSLTSTPHCDTRGFWVSSLSESPVYIGAWAYSASAREREGVEGYPYTQQSFYDEQAFRQNEDVFFEPTKEALEALKAKGVVYLYADRRASRVSPMLDELTDKIWTSPKVTIYRIR